MNKIVFISYILNILINLNYRILELIITLMIVISDNILYSQN